MEVIRDRELHEECGVFGIYGVPNAASLTYYGLHALQHRGQEGAGIVSVDESGTFRRIKGGGLVTEVFDEAKLATLKGSTAIGHVLILIATFFTVVSGIIYIKDNKDVVKG